MHKMFFALLASTFITILPVTVVANEAEMKAQVEEISLGLVERLPMDQKIVLKALSPEQSGLPEDFLRKLTSDLEAALLIASDFEINLANRLSTEELWSEAVEFGDADFQKLYAASQADVMLMLIPRATGAGVEISVTAYRLIGDNAGQVIASSGSVILAMDMESSLGVDVNSLNDQMAQVLQEIEKVGQTGGLISSPNTYAEYYHNARILQQRGESDLAMINYESALSEGYLFVDPALNLIELAIARYGKTAAEVYFEKRVKGSIHEDLARFIDLHFSNDPEEFLLEIIDGNITFEPFLADWFWMYGQQLKSERNNVGLKKRAYDYAILTSARSLVYGMESGSIQNYFLDKIEPSKRYSVGQARAVIRDLNRVEFAFFERQFTVGDGNKVLIRRQECMVNTNAPTFLGNLSDLSMLGEDSKPFFIEDLTTTCSEQPEVSNWSNFGLEPAEIVFNSADSKKAISVENVSLHFEGAGPCYLYLKNNEEFWVRSGFERFDFGRPAQKEINVLFEGNIPRAIFAHEMHPSHDRIVFGDVCAAALAHEGLMDAVDLKPVPEGTTVNLNGVAALMITDDVDTSKPILLYFQREMENGGLFVTDISRDGTYFSFRGAPLGGAIAEYAFSFHGSRNNWLFAPGIVQSSLLLGPVVKAEYTNIFNETVEVQNVQPIQLNTIYANIFSGKDKNGSYTFASEDEFGISPTLESGIVSMPSMQSALQRNWEVIYNLPDILHLGDENIRDWQSLYGKCYEIALPTEPHTAEVAVTFEPYGLERLTVYGEDNQKIDIPPQRVLSGKRPNYWGERLQAVFPVRTGGAFYRMALCAENLDNNDVDDLLLRNITGWAFQ